MMIKEIICVFKGTTKTTVFLGGKDIKLNVEHSIGKWLFIDFNL
jgi:hypothetical protein